MGFNSAFKGLISNLNPYFNELNDLKKKVTDKCYFKGNEFFLHSTFTPYIH